jgi:hypothetical protein
LRDLLDAVEEFDVRVPDLVDQILRGAVALGACQDRRIKRRPRAVASYPGRRR